jgi:hypothetical protein
MAGGGRTVLRYVDSFDHYLTASIGQKWTTVPFSPAVTAGIGSCSSQGLRFSVFNEVVKGIGFGSSTVGFGHLLTIQSTAVSTVLTIGGIGTTNTRHVYYNRNIDGSLSVYRNDADTGFSGVLLGTTAADVIRVGDTYYVEMKTKVHASTGTVDLEVNGASVLALTNQNTQNAAVGAASVTSLWFGNQNGNGNSVWDIDDVYAFDSVAGIVTDLLGPVRVEWLKPDGDGNYASNFSLVGSGSRYLAVRDASGPDGDTSYIQSATVGHKNTSTMEGTGLPSGSIYGVQVLLNARVTDAGFRGIKPMIRQGGSDYLGTEQFPGLSYRYLHEVFETDPNTAAAWNIAGVNAMEVGVQVIT